MNGKTDEGFHPSNRIKNTKYNFITLIPIVLFNQFKYFYNLFYLAISLSQFIPILKVGFLFTYLGPLAFVLIMVLVKEAIEDIQRSKRDKEINSRKFSVLQ
mmetsp:Transcript_16613/g.15898  ORF Transcript_16613/g.15898 Transcript_16613/m.15898 type:complete len:101 (+) Transcript_16613:307-609(+)